MAEHRLSLSPCSDLGQWQSACPLQSGGGTTLRECVEEGPAAKHSPGPARKRGEDPELLPTALWWDEVKCGDLEGSVLGAGKQNPIGRRQSVMKEILQKARLYHMYLSESSEI